MLGEYYLRISLMKKLKAYMWETACLIDKSAYERDFAHMQTVMQ